MSDATGGCTSDLSCCPELAPRLGEHVGTPPDRQACQDSRNSKIGPCRPRPEDTDRGREHRDVSDRVVARTDPHRAHIRVPGSIPKEHRRDREIYCERQETDDAHRAGIW